MAKEDAPTELNVRLEWPEVESPAVTKRRLPARVPSRKRARSDERALLPRRRGRSGATEAPAAQVDTRARMASALSAPELNQLSTRVEELAGAVGDHAADARLKRTSADLRTLTKRVDSLTRAVAALPNGAALAELVGRVDTLAHTVEMLCEHIGSGAHRFDPVEHQIAATLEPLREATEQVRGLIDTVSHGIGSRSDRHAGLRIQMEALAREVRGLRRSLPVGKTAAKKAAGKKAPVKKTAAKKTAGKKAPVKKTAAKKTAKKTTAKKTTSRKAAPPKRSGRAASATT